MIYFTSIFPDILTAYLDKFQNFCIFYFKLNYNLFLFELHLARLYQQLKNLNCFKILKLRILLSKFFARLRFVKSFELVSVNYCIYAHISVQYFEPLEFLE